MKMKKLILSVFALSAMMLSACSGGEQTPDSSAAGDSSTTQQSSSAASSSSAAASSSAADASSSDAGSSSSVEPVTVPADYRVEIGDAVYDLLLDESQTEFEKQYYFGANVSKTVAKDESIVFKKLANNTYSLFEVEPSPHDAAGWTYNNVLVEGTDYTIKEGGSVQVYLKQDKTSHEWSFWITGGGAIPKPDEGWYLRGENIGSEWSIDPNYVLEEGTGEDAGKFYINYTAVEADEFKICHIDDQGKETWYPYNKGTKDEPDYVGYYKNSTEAKSAIYNGYLYGDKDYNLQTIVPGNYRIEIDTNDDDFGIWTSLNEDAEHKPLRTDLMYGIVGQEQYAEAAPFGTLSSGGYKYSITVPLGELSTEYKIFCAWKDDSNFYFELDDEDNPSIKNYFVINDDNTLSLKAASTKVVEIIFALQCGKMVVSAVESTLVTFRVQAEGGLTSLYVVGDFNNWTPSDDYKLTEVDTTNHFYETTPSAALCLGQGEQGFKFYNEAAEDKYEFAGNNRTINLTGSSFVTPIYIYGNPEGHVGEYYLVLGSGTSWSSESLTPNGGKTEYSITQLELEAREEFKINLDGSWRGFDDLKPSSPVLANFKEASADNNIEVVTGGTYNIYVKVTPETAEGVDQGKSIYIEEYVAPIVHNVTAKIGENPVALTDIKDPADEQNLGVYLIQLEKDDTIEFKDNETNLHFLTAEGATSYQANISGKYYFYYSKDGLMYVSAPVTYTVTSTTVESGFSVYLVGDYYGNWQPQAAYKLTYADDKYSGTFELPGGEGHEYKYVKVKDDDPTIVIWETYEDSKHNNNRVVNASSAVQPLTEVTATFAAYVAPVAVSFSANVSKPAGWNPAADNYSLYIWGDASKPLGEWNDCLGNLTVTENVASINANIAPGTWNAILYFKQGEITKQSNDLEFTVSAAGSFTISLGEMTSWSGNTFNGATIAADS